MQYLAKSAVVAAALAVAIIANSPSAADAADNSSPRRHLIEIHKLKFIPAELEAAPGDTIVWINRDIVPHTITAADKSWDSGTIKKSSQWQTVVRSEIPGAYFCRFHPTMKARIRIVN